LRAYREGEKNEKNLGCQPTSAAFAEGSCARQLCVRACVRARACVSECVRACA
jgi:hypothetical protein